MQYASTMRLADMSNVSKSIWVAANTYKSALYRKAAKRKAGRKEKAPINKLKLYLLLYLSGRRLKQILTPPYPELMRVEKFGFVVMRLVWANGDYQDIPIDDIHEKAMWDVITEDGTRLSLDFIADLKYEDRNSLCNSFRKMIRADVNDGTRDIPQKPLPPAALSMLRYYNLAINKEYDEGYVSDFFREKRYGMTARHDFLANALKARREQALRKQLQGRKLPLKLVLGEIPNPRLI